MIELFDKFAYLVVFFSAALSFLSIIYYNRINKLYCSFYAYLFVGGVVDLCSLITGEKGHNNLWFFHIFAFFELLLLSLFFEKISKELGHKNKLGWIYIPCLLFIIFNSIYIQPLDKYNSYSATLVSFVLIVFSVVIFRYLIEYSGAHYGRFKYAVGGILLYHMTSIVILSSANLMMVYDEDSQLAIWVVRAMIILVTKLMFLYVLFLNIKSNKKMLS